MQSYELSPIQLQKWFGFNNCVETLTYVLLMLLSSTVTTLVPYIYLPIWSSMHTPNTSRLTSLLLAIVSSANPFGLPLFLEKTGLYILTKPLIVPKFHSICPSLQLHNLPFDSRGCQTVTIADNSRVTITDNPHVAIVVSLANITTRRL